MEDTRLSLLGGQFELLEAVGSAGEVRVVKALDRRHAGMVALRIKVSRARVTAT